MRSSHPIRLLAVGLLMTLLSACSFIRVSDNPILDEETFWANPPRSLAIAKVVNNTKIEDIGESVRTRLYSALAPLPYEDVELDVVDRYINAKAMLLDVPPAEVAPVHLAESELADAVVFFQIEKVNRFFLIVYAQVRVDLRMIVVESDSRKQLYSNRMILRNHAFSIPISPLGVIQSLVSTLWHIRREELNHSLDAIAQEVAKRFPAPPGGAVSGSTFIARVDVGVPTPTLREGDRVSIKVKGLAGCDVSFSIGKILRRQPMIETSPGRYSGVYIVEKGDHGRFLFVSVSMANPKELDQSVHFDAIDQSFAIDTVPPGPYEVSAWTRNVENGGVTLQFRPETSPPNGSAEQAVAFRIYRTSEPGGPLTLVGASQEPSFEDRSARPEMAYEYGIVAQDALGNSSEIRSRALVTLRESKELEQARPTQSFLNLFPITPKAPKPPIYTSLQAH